MWVLQRVIASMININQKMVRAVQHARKYLSGMAGMQRILLLVSSFFYYGLFLWAIFCVSFFYTGFIGNQALAADDDLQSFNSSKMLPAQQDLAEQFPILANFAGVSASMDVKHLADWVIDSGDNHHLPFVIVDKRDAKVFVFNAGGQLSGASPALLGLALGDESAPGIGNRKLQKIRPDERTTPAGRFVASLGRNLSGKDVLWVDYQGGVSMHRVKTSKPKEWRLQRLNTPTSLDNRISYGCINVPVQFYEHVVRPAFIGTSGIVYVLPEVKQMSETFKSYYIVKLPP